MCKCTIQHHLRLTFLQPGHENKDAQHMHIRVHLVRHSANVEPTDLLREILNDSKGLDVQTGDIHTGQQADMKQTNMIGRHADVADADDQ